MSQQHEDVPIDPATGKAQDAGEKLQLSPNERLVLRLLSQGLGTIAVAEQMSLDPRSVQNYIAALFRKTGHIERTQLVEWYRRHDCEESE